MWWERGVVAGKSPRQAGRRDGGIAMRARRRAGHGLWLTNTLCRLMVGEIVAAPRAGGQPELFMGTAETRGPGLVGRGRSENRMLQQRVLIQNGGSLEEAWAYSLPVF